MAKFYKELSAPGSVLGENHDEFPCYESFQAAERMRQQRELAQRIMDAQEVRRGRQIARLNEQRQEGPDTADLAELVAGGVCGFQIAKMKQTTVAEIERQCREAGLPVPSRRYSQSAEVKGPWAPEVRSDVAEARERIEAARCKAFQDRPRPEQAEPTRQPKANEEPEATDDEPPAPAHDFGGDPDATGSVDDFADDATEGEGD